MIRSISDAPLTAQIAAVVQARTEVIMPFFPHESDEEKRRKAEVKARRVATVEALRKGEIPPAVLQRLADVGPTAFTSTLSVSDAFLARQVGLRRSRTLRDQLFSP
jgi:hypothetical protein